MSSEDHGQGHETGDSESEEDFAETVLESHGFLLEIVMSKSVSIRCCGLHDPSKTLIWN